MKTATLYNQHSAQQFYEERYAQGYMDDWPVAKKQRVFELIRSLPLPEKGKALDFGCGNGIFTEVIRQALPGWEVYGTDISATALEAARQRFPHCSFFGPEANGTFQGQFDFVFSHHVLEHVFDLDAMLAEINDCLKAQAAMLHILPCGNPGSFEQRIASMRTDGINQALQGRFFFEDEGHVRRLTSAQLTALVQQYGFRPLKAFFANQYYGAIDWITATGEGFINHMFDDGAAKDWRRAWQIRYHRNKLLWIGRMHLISARGHRFYVWQFRKKRISAPGALMGLVTYPFVKFASDYYRRRATTEWLEGKARENGSEMYLFFGR